MLVSAGKQALVVEAVRSVVPLDSASVRLVPPSRVTIRGTVIGNACKAKEVPTPESEPPHAASDERGVDRTQIREMLRLTPEERLRRVEEFVESLLEIRELNEERQVR